MSVWGWIWGFAGMVIAVPLMVVIKIICENVEFLKPVSILLGTAPAAVPDGMTISEAEAEAAEAAVETAAETTPETESTAD